MPLASERLRPRRPYRLAIVQGHTSQFDAPLYRLIASDDDVELTVYYTEKDVELFDPELGRQSGWSKSDYGGYHHRYLSHSLRGRVIDIFRLIKTDPDLIIINGYTSALYLTIAVSAFLHRNKVGLRSDSLPTPVRTWKSRVKKAVFSVLHSLFATGHPTGKLAAKNLQELGFSANALFRFPYCVDNDWLAAAASEHYRYRGDIKRGLGISPRSVVLVAVQKLIAREDPMTLLRAFHACSSQGLMVELVCVGDGALREDMEEYIVANRLTSVHLVGYQQYRELPKFYSIADVFIHSARREPWGGSVGEAMACGLPVILSDQVGAGADLLTPGETGFVFQAGNCHQLQHHISTLVLDAGLRGAMSDACVRRIQGLHYREALKSIKSALEYATEGTRGEKKRSGSDEALR